MASIPESFAPEDVSVPERIARAMLVDQARFRRRLKRLGVRRLDSPAGQQFLSEVDASVHRSDARIALSVVPTYPGDLPITAIREQLLRSISKHQVVVVSGATGSGKTTQLPKLCLELGRGARALIGHTQPRRLAARRVAARIAEELGVEHHGVVGYQIRFNTQVDDACRLKVMTDGILLAEVQGEPRLNRYDTIIIDEAHERTLNIDFLLGYLKRLLVRRTDMKVIVSSATIDAQRYAEFFGGAPVVEVSGRMYPVEVRYQAPIDLGPEPELEAARTAVIGLCTQEQGDVLVFLPGERQIRALSTTLRGALPAGTEILPLYARLAAAEQDKVFAPVAGRRRVVLATNLAETSLTVPGVRHVVDTGLARISRYSHRATVQSLPIEPIAQASAQQRTGRAGRLGPGICVRCYSEEDYAQRSEYTEPEIRRANLAAVLLRLAALGIKEIEEFPFLDPPDRRHINDGHRLLRELGAFDDDNKLTPTGHRLARLPVDPRVGRMILEASELDCLREVLIIASGLAIADPRERMAAGGRGHEANPADGGVHERFRDSRSDFMAMLRLWRHFQNRMSRDDEGRFRGQCRRLHLSPLRLREWQDVNDQLNDVAREVGLRANKHAGSYGKIHRALLSGLVRNIGHRSAEREYTGVRDAKFLISPSSYQYAAGHPWVMTAELVETARLYGFRVASIRPEWIERHAGALLRRNHFEAHWDPQRAEAMVYEQTSLYGLVVVARRRVRLASVSRVDARDMFIRAGLVEGGFLSPAHCLARNAATIERLRNFDHKLRRPDMLVNDDKVHAFYDSIVPDDVVEGASFEAWRRRVERDDPARLCLSEAQLRDGELIPDLDAQYPDYITAKGVTLTLCYHFAPTDPADGVSVRVPLRVLRDLDPGRFEWLVPGLLGEKVLALLRLLPKSMRRSLVPLPAFAASFLISLPAVGEPSPDPLKTDPGPLEQGLSLRRTLADFVAARTAIEVPMSLWSTRRLEAELAPYLRTRYEVLDDGGVIVAAGRDLAELQRRLLSISPPMQSMRRLNTSKDWQFGDLVEHEEVEDAGVLTMVYPALVDRRDSVERIVVATRGAAERITRQGLVRLFAIRVRRTLSRQLREFPQGDGLRLGYLLVPDNVLLGHWSRNRDLDGADEARGATSLDDELIDLVAARTFVQGAAVTRSRREFETRLADGFDKLEAQLAECTALVQSTLDGLRAVRAALDAAAPALPLRSLADINRQITHLYYRGYIGDSDFEVLAAYPRYVRALLRRIEKLSQGGSRDATKIERFEPYWLRYETRLREHHDRGRYDAALRDYRWMLEEYRISVFAQELGTAFPVSSRRLDRQWREVSG